MEHELTPEEWEELVQGDTEWLKKREESEKFSRSVTSALQKSYNELLQAVKVKYQDETRHQAALRCIRKGANRGKEREVLKANGPTEPK